MKKQIMHYYCDFCKKEFFGGVELEYLISGHGDGQYIFDENENIIEICKSCSITLYEANKFGLLKLDAINIHKLYLASGYHVISEDDNKVCYQFEDKKFTMVQVFK